MHQTRRVDDMDDNLTSAHQDATTESAILQHVLALHPVQVTIDELARELGEETVGVGFAGRDAVERAVRDLAGTGLLHCNDSFVLPTRAALRFDELLNR
ncbi:MAG TPA: hypothetical protein VF176_07370 [Solirubrobacterales bacterium]